MDYISPDRIFSLRSRKKASAIRELVEATCRTIPQTDAAAVLRAVWDRESLASSWIAPGIAIPHGRVEGLGEFYVAIGRSRQGIQYESADGKPVNLLILIIADSGEVERYIQLLAEVARTLKLEHIKEMILSSRSSPEVYRIIQQGSRLVQESQKGTLQKVSRSLLTHAMRLAEEVHASAIILHIDAMADREFLRAVEPQRPMILITQRKDLGLGELNASCKIIQVPFPGLNRANQVRLTLLLALSQGLIGRQDRIVGLFGTPERGALDSITIVDVAQEVPVFLPASSAGLFGDVKPAVLERVLQLATELASEGREGRPVGTLFVLGDYRNVRRMSHQLVINPFKGYRDEEKSILDPSLEETVKEFSSLDGAFILQGDGVIKAAGVYLRFAKAMAELPSGLGARHAAAANITACTDALSVVVSQSTGRVSLFRAGKTIISLDRPKT